MLCCCLLSGVFSFEVSAISPTSYSIGYKTSTGPNNWYNLGSNTSYNFNANTWISGGRIGAWINNVGKGRNFAGRATINLAMEWDYYTASYSDLGNARNAFQNGTIRCGIGDLYNSANISSLQTTRNVSFSSSGGYYRPSIDIVFSGVYSSDIDGGSNFWCEAYGDGDLLLGQNISGGRAYTIIGGNIEGRIFQDATDAINWQTTIIQQGQQQQHLDSQAQTDAIKEGNQAEQDRWDQDKQEETDRENQAMEDQDELLSGFGEALAGFFFPFANLFDDGANTCRQIPVLAEWLNLADSTICPFFPAKVRNGVSIAIVGLMSILTFAFIVNRIKGVN